MLAIVRNPISLPEIFFRVEVISSSMSSLMFVCCCFCSCCCCYGDVAVLVNFQFLFLQIFFPVGLAEWRWSWFGIFSWMVDYLRLYSRWFSRMFSLQLLMPCSAMFFKCTSELHIIIRVVVFLSTGVGSFSLLLAALMKVLGTLVLTLSSWSFRF